MFTGLIQSTGTVVSLMAGGGATRLVIAAPQLVGRWGVGDSIAVNGVCLTALPEKGPAGLPGDPSRFAADLAAETLARTTLGGLRPGAVVNLELPTPAGSPLGGHVVQGHVDGVGKVISLVPLHPSREATDWRLTLELPSPLAAQVAPQGSIAVDGISLTVARADHDGPHQPRVEIAIIPHTYRATHLHTLTPGSAVNIETDVLAKYAAQRPVTRADWLTREYLLANGY